MVADDIGKKIETKPLKLLNPVRNCKLICCHGTLWICQSQSKAGKQELNNKEEYFQVRDPHEELFTFFFFVVIKGA